MFCYSRDRAVPLSWLWTKFNHTTQSPLYAVWGAALATILIGLPMLGSQVRGACGRGGGASQVTGKRQSGNTQLFSTCWAAKMMNLLA